MKPSSQLILLYHTAVQESRIRYPSTHLSLPPCLSPSLPLSVSVSLTSLLGFFLPADRCFPLGGDDPHRGSRVMPCPLRSPFLLRRRLPSSVCSSREGVCLGPVGSDLLSQAVRHRLVGLSQVLLQQGVGGRCGPSPFRDP